MKTKLNWSVCIIARNEEKTLPRMLGSLKEFISLDGEVLILDTGSTDKTVEVAKSFGAKVIEVGDKFVHKHTDEIVDAVNERFVVEGDTPVMKYGDKNFDFAAARNYLASLASNDMISMPDADEQFTTLKINLVSKMIEEGVEQLIYPFVFSHDAFGNPAIKFYHSKFYDRRKLKWTGIVHEILGTINEGDTVNSRTIDENVIYLEHFQNTETKRGQYLTGLAYDLYLNPDKDRNSHYFGRELMYTNRFSSAIKELVRHINMNKWHTERSESALYIGDCYLWLGKDKEALSWYNLAYTIDGDRREPFLRLADYYYKRNDAKRVIAYAEASLTIPLTNFYANDNALYTYKPHEYLYWAYWQTGNKEKSKEHFFKAIGYAPQNPKYLSDKIFYE